MAESDWQVAAVDVVVQPAADELRHGGTGGGELPTTDSLDWRYAGDSTHHFHAHAHGESG